MTMKAVNIKNKKATFQYEIIEEFVAGMVLKGTEIKSIRQSKASIGEAYCYLEQGELYVKNMYIAPYEQASFTQHEPRGTRKLLLNKKELRRIEKELKVKGITIVALRLFITEKGYAKIKIALARGKKLFDKRESLKEKDSKRQLDRLKKIR